MSESTGHLNAADCPSWFDGCRCDQMVTEALDIWRHIASEIVLRKSQGRWPDGHPGIFSAGVCGFLRAEGSGPDVFIVGLGYPCIVQGSVQFHGADYGCGVRTLADLDLL